ncbi:transcriptional regulator, TetR family [Kytococcus aerolatus]|uniref:Transcriptional regulator, TetR family n=1 Tax=Kytococcus aerolatus TaxID=592308 RepID=A0A212TG00_9MICO|nr:TetR family transcriptional regulator [Kytococcus aerolatus]SNC64741.1 transcriptional regulator, TetR family [Kytococcus aerolatus]
MNSKPAASSRRDTVTDAAIEVLAREGMRGLTHRAVDAEAGLPSGSTSNHFRTRQQLVVGVVDRLAARDVADLEDLVETLRDSRTTHGNTAPGPQHLIANLLGHWQQSAGTRLVARLTLSTEGLRDPDVATGLADGRQRIVALVDDARQTVARTTGADPLGVVTTDQAIALLSAGQWARATHGVDLTGWLLSAMTGAGRQGVTPVPHPDGGPSPEATHLMRPPANARRLLDAMDRLEAGGGTEHELIETD